MDSWEDFDQAEEEATPSGELGELVKLGDELVAVSDLAAQAEAEAKRHGVRAKEISEKLLPTMMEDLGLASFTLSSGKTVGLKDDIHVTTSGKYRQIVCDWLREIGRDAGVRRTVSVEFGKGEISNADELAEKLVSTGYRTIAADMIHPGTFKSLVKEMIEEGAEVPMDQLGAYQRTLATVKK